MLKNIFSVIVVGMMMGSRKAPGFLGQQFVVKNAVVQSGSAPHMSASTPPSMAVPRAIALPL